MSRKKLKPEVVPYLIGGDLNLTLLIDGVEIEEFEIPLALLFEHFAGCIDPNDESHENAALDLIFACEAGIRTVNDRLGEQE